MNLSRPFLPRWWHQYPVHHLRSDLMAGILVTILVLPQSLAYAMLAGLPPQLGLYASTLPVLVYALVGSSMTQALGPVAITAIMTFSILSPLAVPGTAHYFEMSTALALLSGLLVFAFGLLRLGFLSNLLSRPVIGGFISGSAFLILLSQFKLLLGIQAHASSNWGLLIATIGQLPQTNGYTALIGGLGVVFLSGSRLFLARGLALRGVASHKAAMASRLAPLLAVVIATIAVVVFDLDRLQEVRVVGDVDVGWPDFWPKLPGMADLQMLLAPALIMALIGAVQNITMAQALAVKRHERTEANKELIGLGLANVMASFVGGMPVGGGLSRSAVNVASGAQTPLASIVSAAFMLLIMLMGTTWFSRMPLAILAASIMVAAVSMIDIAGFKRAWHYDRADAFAFLGTALGVLILGLQAGIALGIFLSVANLMYRASTPHIAVVGRIVGTEHFRNVERHGVETLPGVLFVRIDESLFFGNLSAIELRVLNELTKQPNTRAVVLIMSAVNRIDVTALDALTELVLELQSRGILLHMAEVKGPVQDKMLNTALWGQLSARVHLSVNAAFEALKPDGS